ncbi:MAG: ABC transporter permease [Flavobacteriales bacterium]|nr:ABC transporter permease [Flavobacteriales bacterium]MCB9191240.1 ABC transporter permease [Flavobacteriales bacterium]MCB9204227.1 ABC transporter permease [Flavobacteriales bacterium]
MNTSFFIAKRLIRTGGRAESSNISGTRPIVRIAIAGIALGLAVMIVSMAIVTGFQKEITDKVVNFGADIIITEYSNLNAIEPQPVSKQQDFYPGLTEIDGIRHMQVFATKAGIVKTDEEIEGVVVKGVGSDFDWSFFKQHLVAGDVFETTDESRSKNILISEVISKKLKLNVGDRMQVFFIQDERQRARIFDVSGIYKTGLSEYDERYVITDITHIQRLNGWDEDQVAGFEVFVDDFSRLDELDDVVYHSIGTDLFSATVKELQPQIFDWLDLQDTNVRVIIILMLVVAGFNMISALLIMIIERVYMIGTLKSLGMNDSKIRNIFIYQALYLTGVGLFWGNLVGIALCLIQDQFGIITLDEASYYVKVVPINLQLTHILLLNLGTLFFCFLMLLLPSMVVSRIQPLKAIRFT